MSGSGRVQSPLLVGRDDVLALMDRRTSEAASGRGNLVMLAGEAGIGKTRLLGAISRQAVAAGFRYANGALAPQDQLVPLASLRDLARSMDPGKFGDLGRTILDMRGGKGRDSLASRRILVREIAEAIVEAVDRPTLLAFEDLQWADELSLEVLGVVARDGRERPLFLLAAYRLDELPIGSIHREWRSRLLTQRIAEEVRLDRLSQSDTALVTSLILGTGLPAPREVARAVYRRTNGIPLHIEELIAALGPEVVADGRSIIDASVPDTIEDAVLARTQRLSAEAIEVALAGAVIGRCFAPEVLAGIMDRPAAELDAPLQELVDNAVVYPFEFVGEGYFDFRHQLLRDALYASVPAPRLRLLHARAAEFGASLVGASEVHASLHFERAGLRAKAFEAALAGARAAAEVSSRHEAFELYRRAVKNLPDELPTAERGVLYQEYADAASAVDNIPEIEAAATLARELFLEAGDPVRAVEALGVISNVARRDVWPRSERLRLLEQADDELRSVPPSPERSRRLESLSFDRALLALDTGRVAEARGHAAAWARAIDESGAADLDMRFITAHADVATGDADAGVQTMLDLARLARDAGREAFGVTAYRDAGTLAIQVMDYARAREGLAEGLRYADEVQQSYCRRVMAATSAHLAWASGDWDEAVATAELELVDPGGRRAELAARTALAYVAVGRGLVDRARDLLDGALTIARPSSEPELILPVLWGLAEAALVASDAARATAHCQDAFEFAMGQERRALLVPFVVTGTRAAQAGRRPEEASRWLERVSGALAGLDAVAAPALAHADGLVKLAAGSTLLARASLDAAVGGWDGQGRIWEATWARLDLAAALLRSGHHVDAMQLVDAALATAGRLGSQPLMARAEKLVPLGRGRTAEQEPWHPLTIREFEVARHIAAGMTNAEIAAEIFVSPKTVSAHVEHMLAKLGANRRAEIASWVAGVTQPVA